MNEERWAYCLEKTKELGLSIFDIATAAEVYVHTNIRDKKKFAKACELVKEAYFLATHHNENDEAEICYRLNDLLIEGKEVFEIEPSELIV